MGTVMQELITGCVNDAIENEGGKFSVNQSGFDGLLKFGECVDIIATHTTVYDVAAGVRTGMKSGFVSFAVDDLVFERGASDPFFSAIQGVDTIEFAKSKDGRLTVTATVEDILVHI